MDEDEKYIRKLDAGLYTLQVSLSSFLPLGAWAGRFSIAHQAVFLDVSDWIVCAN